jgi:hypothetical protein
LLPVTAMTLHPGRLLDHVHPGVADVAAFVLDPDGNGIEAVWHGPATRSAGSPAVELRR